MPAPSDEPSAGGAAVYEIRVKGHLPDYRAACFPEMAIERDREGNTALRGPVADQAALHGLLERIRDLGLTLLAVNRA